jgi:hypothetical protein
MKSGKSIFVICSLLLLWGCAYYPRVEGVPTSKIIQCPDGNRPFMDCRMAFDQYKKVLKFDVNIIDAFGTGIGIGAQPLISLDSITGDLLAHKHQVCIEYNNCMISKEEYAKEQKYLRRAQMEIRKLATSANINVGQSSPQPVSVQTEAQDMSLNISIDETINKAQDSKEVALNMDTNVSNPVIFDQLNSLESKMEALKKKTRGLGVTKIKEDMKLSDSNDEKTIQKVNIEYTLQVRREKSSGSSGGQKIFEPIKFAPGATLRSGDQFKINFKTDNDGYVYIINFDSSGNSNIIFPHPEAGSDNNVKGQEKYEIPVSSGSWYYLDDVKGKETLYVIASPFQIPNLDNLVSDLRQNKSNSREGLKNARLRGSLDALTRGVGVLADEKPEKEKMTQSSAMTTKRIEFNHQ